MSLTKLKESLNKTDIEFVFEDLNKLNELILAKQNKLDGDVSDRPIVGIYSVNSSVISEDITKSIKISIGLPTNFENKKYTEIYDILEESVRKIYNQLLCDNLIEEPFNCNYGQSKYAENYMVITFDFNIGT